MPHSAVKKSTVTGHLCPEGLLRNNVQLNLKYSCFHLQINNSTKCRNITGLLELDKMFTEKVDYSAIFYTES